MTATAKVLDARWIPIRPATDAALLDAMAYVILKEGLEDRDDACIDLTGGTELMSACGYRIAKEYNMMARDYISDEKPPTPQRDSLMRPQKLSPQERVAVNQADTTLLQRVPGIGPYYARRIVSYRQRLGGYYRTEQLLEIEGFPESALSYFSIADEAVVRKLNVNRLSLNELRQHPYVGYYRAKQIVDFRRTHGRISSLNELSLSKDFTPEVIERLEHYVEY